MKEQDIKETAILLRNEIAKSQNLTSDVDLHTIFLSAETIVSCLSFLISPIADMEQKYRQKIVELIFVPGAKERSHAQAEAMAKASDEYKDWRKYSALYELGHEQIMLLKKFREDLSNERVRS